MRGDHLIKRMTSNCLINKKFVRLIAAEAGITLADAAHSSEAQGDEARQTIYKAIVCMAALNVLG